MFASFLKQSIVLGMFTHSWATTHVTIEFRIHDSELCSSDVNYALGMQAEGIRKFKSVGPYAHTEIHGKFESLGYYPIDANDDLGETLETKVRKIFVPSTALGCFLQSEGFKYASEAELDFTFETGGETKLLDKMTHAYAERCRGNVYVKVSHKMCSKCHLSMHECPTTPESCHLECPKCWSQPCARAVHARGRITQGMLGDPDSVPLRADENHDVWWCSSHNPTDYVSRDLYAFRRYYSRLHRSRRLIRRDSDCPVMWHILDQIEAA